MIYYNDMAALEESGFDVISAIADSPLYEEFVEYDAFVESSSYITEAQMIKLDVLTESVFSTIFEKIKAAFEAVKRFFSGIISKIKSFFSKKTTEKVAKAAMEAVEKEEKEMKTNPELKARLEAKFKAMIPKFNERMKTSYAFLNCESVAKEFIDTRKHANFKKLQDKFSHGASTKDYTFLKQLSELEDFKNFKAEKFSVNKVPTNDFDKIVEKCKNNPSISILNPATKKKLIKDLMGTSNLAFLQLKSVEGLAEKIEKDANTVSDTIDLFKSINPKDIATKWNKKELKDYYIDNDTVDTTRKKVVNKEMDNSAEIRKLIKTIVPMYKAVLNCMNSNAGAVRKFTNACMKCHKDALREMITIGGTANSSLKKEYRDLHGENLSKYNESYDPWSGLDESYDPWSGLDESYDPWGAI